MKFVYSALLVLIFSPVFAGGSDLMINDSITMSESVLPDKMISTLSLTYTSADFAAASKGMEKLAVIFKSESEICTYKSYRISPKYSYDKGTQKLQGYQGSISSECRFDKISDFDSILEKVHSAASSENYTISQSPVYWAVDENILKSAQERLKLNIVKAAREKASEFSRASQQDCTVSSINFSGSYTPQQPQLMARTASESTPPDQSETSVSVNASYSLICR